MQRRQRAGVEELVRQCNLPEPVADLLAHQQPGHSFPKAADGRMVFRDNNRSALTGCLRQDGRFVERLDRRAV